MSYEAGIKAGLFCIDKCSEREAQINAARESEKITNDFFRVKKIYIKIVKARGPKRGKIKVNWKWTLDQDRMKTTLKNKIRLSDIKLPRYIDVKNMKLSNVNFEAYTPYDQEHCITTNELIDNLTTAIRDTIITMYKEDRMDRLRERNRNIKKGNLLGNRVRKTV